MAFFTFRSILKHGREQDKEAPDEAFIGDSVSRAHPWCRAVCEHLEPAAGGGATVLKCLLHTLHKYVMLSCHFLHHVHPITTLKGSVVLEEFFTPCGI